MIAKIKKAMIGFRKYSIMLVIIGIAIWFRLAELINGDNVADLLKTVAAAFFAGNLTEHITDTIKQKAKEKVKDLKD